MDNYSFWIHVPDNRVYAVWCIDGEVHAAVRISPEDPDTYQPSEFKQAMTLGAGDWIREEIDNFKELTK